MSRYVEEDRSHFSPAISIQTEIPNEHTSLLLPSNGNIKSKQINCGQCTQNTYKYLQLEENTYAVSFLYII